RDIKLGNSLLDDKGCAAVTDFGIARVLAATQSTTGLLGTPFYMAPEQILGQHDLDNRADIYSLAVAAYLLATGCHPFTSDQSMTVLQQHLTAQPIHPFWYRLLCRQRPFLQHPIAPESDRSLIGC
ncbi:MAG TPA: protein kinase, partial [Phototrophicaceae bacterium]|nr:protein kinase [Phototrophicaceae bacterium]